MVPCFVPSWEINRDLWTWTKVSLSLYLCFSKSAAAWHRTGPGTSWATPRRLTSPVCWHHPGIVYFVWITITRHCCDDAHSRSGQNLFLKNSLCWGDRPQQCWAGARRDSCLLQTKKSVSRLLGSQCCRESARATCGSQLSSAEPACSFHRLRVLMISKSKARSEWQCRECCGYHWTVTRETWKLKCVSLRLRVCIHTVAKWFTPTLSTDKTIAEWVS